MLEKNKNFNDSHTAATTWRWAVLYSDRYLGVVFNNADSFPGRAFCTGYYIVIYYNRIYYYRLI